MVVDLLAAGLAAHAGGDARRRRAAGGGHRDGASWNRTAGEASRTRRSTWPARTWWRTGDFTLSAAFTDVTADASLTVYDSPPVIADEFRIEPAGLRLTLRGDDLDIAVFDGSPPEGRDQSRSRRTTSTFRLQDPRAPLTVRRSGDRLEVGERRGHCAVAVPSAASSAPGSSGWDSRATAAPSRSAPSPPPLPSGASLTTAGPAVAGASQLPDGLQALAARIRPDFRIGAAVALGPLASDAGLRAGARRKFRRHHPGKRDEAADPLPAAGRLHLRGGGRDPRGRREQGHGRARPHHRLHARRCPAGCRSFPRGTEAERSASAAALLDYVTRRRDALRGPARLARRRQRAVRRRPGNRLQQNIWYRVFGPGYPAVVSQAVYDGRSGREAVHQRERGRRPGAPPGRAAQARPATRTRVGGHIYGVGLQAHVYDLDTDAIPADDLTDDAAPTSRTPGCASASRRTTSRTTTGRTSRPSSTPRSWPPACARAPASPTRRGAWTTATTG